MNVKTMHRAPELDAMVMICRRNPFEVQLELIELRGHARWLLVRAHVLARICARGLHRKSLHKKRPFKLLFLQRNSLY